MMPFASDSQRRAAFVRIYQKRDARRLSKPKPIPSSRVVRQEPVTSLEAWHLQQELHARPLEAIIEDGHKLVSDVARHLDASKIATKRLVLDYGCLVAAEMDMEAQHQAGKAALVRGVQRRFEDELKRRGTADWKIEELHRLTWAWIAAQAHQPGGKK